METHGITQMDIPGERIQHFLKIESSAGINWIAVYWLDWDEDNINFNEYFWIYSLKYLDQGRRESEALNTEHYSSTMTIGAFHWALARAPMSIHLTSAAIHGLISPQTKTVGVLVLSTWQLPHQLTVLLSMGKILNENSTLCGPGRDKIEEVIVIQRISTRNFLLQTKQLLLLSQKW